MKEDSKDAYKLLLDTVGAGDIEWVEGAMGMRDTGSVQLAYDSSLDLILAPLLAEKSIYDSLKMEGMLEMIRIARRALIVAEAAQKGLNVASVIEEARAIVKNDIAACKSGGTTYKLVGIESLIIRDWHMIRGGSEGNLVTLFPRVAEQCRRMREYLMVVEAEHLWRSTP